MIVFFSQRTQWPEMLQIYQKLIRNLYLEVCLVLWMYWWIISMLKLYFMEYLSQECTIINYNTYTKVPNKRTLNTQTFNSCKLSLIASSLNIVQIFSQIMMRISTFLVLSAGNGILVWTFSISVGWNWWKQ